MVSNVPDDVIVRPVLEDTLINASWFGSRFLARASLICKSAIIWVCSIWEQLENVFKDINSRATQGTILGKTNSEMGFESSGNPWHTGGFSLRFSWRTEAA